MVIMRDFSLKKTRVISIISIAWCFISYWLITGGLTYYLDSDFYYKMIGYGSYDWQWVRGDFIVFTSPVWIYWIVIPFIKTVINWIKKGV
jgi:hypothetical protein